MRQFLRSVVVVAMGFCGMIGAAEVVFAKGGGATPAAPAKGPALEPRLVVAAKALTDTNPTLIEDALVKSKHRIELSGELMDVPIACATTVKGSKSNTSERKRAAPMLSAMYDRSIAASQPLWKIAKHEASEAIVGTITIDRELAFRGKDASRTIQKIPAGTFGVALRARENHALVGIEIQEADGTTLGGVDINADALARQLVAPAEFKLVADFFANAVIMNFVVAMLDEDTTAAPVTIAARATGTGMEPMVGTLGKLHVGWAGGGIDIVPGKSVVVGSETIAVGEIAEVRIAWEDAPAGRIPGATIVNRAGAEIPITTGSGSITAIDLSMTPAKGSPVAWNWKPGGATPRTAKPAEVTVISFGK